VKPFVALGALNEGIANADTTIVSRGYISIPNPYHPNQPSIFPDWKVLGKLNLKQAIAHSSDVYFYELGGGYQNQKGLGISGLNKYYNMFGLGDQPTVIALPEARGNIPNPSWKKTTFPNDPIWRLGDTYHTAIGQYGVQVTPLQMVRADAAIANGGKLLTPSIIKHKNKSDISYDTLPISQKDFQIDRYSKRSQYESNPYCRKNRYGRTWTWQEMGQFVGHGILSL
jgi:penicillin-binding protein 2